MIPQEAGDGRRVPRAELIITLLIILSIIGSYRVSRRYRSQYPDDDLVTVG